ncbi:MAG: hypothetical protein R2807_00395 [Chitinophagales bacterium]
MLLKPAEWCFPLSAGNIMIAFTLSFILGILAGIILALAAKMDWWKRYVANKDRSRYGTRDENELRII